ncbi:MAG: phosphodiesterase YaeI [Pseudomonadota bacterium]|nr:phosphodiesterase YaeI [Pseudomonadota bacterium]
MNRRHFLRAVGKRVVGYGLPVLTTGVYSLSIEPQWLRLHHQRIPLSGLQGLRIVQLSDLHLEPYVALAHIENAVKRAHAQHPHLIVLTGDYADTLSGLAQLPAVLSQLQAPLGVYAVLGNHDMALGLRAVRQTLAASGITLLENRGLILTFENTDFYLAGLADSFSGQPDLDAALAHLPRDMLCILLSHEPDIAGNIAEDGRVDLQLSGHTHGGQVRIPFWGAPVRPPLGKKYPQGLAQVGSMQLYTTRGVGLIGPPVRFNCRPEISLLVLNSESVWQNPV